MYKKIRMNPEALRRFAALCTITFSVLLATMSSVEAAEWRIEPVIRLAGDFDDNAFLSTRTDIESETGYIAEASARFSYASDTTDFYITPIFRTSDYGSDSDLNSDDQFLRMNYRHNTETSDFRFRARYDRESVRTAERADTDLDVLDPDEILDDDSGRVFILDRRERFQITPSYLYRVTAASSLGLQLDHSDVRYDEALEEALTDYTDTRVNASYRHRWTSRNTGVLTGTFRNYQTDRGENDVSGVGLKVGLDRALSETAHFRVAVGIENTEVADNKDDSNWVANVSYVRQLKTTTLLAQYRRSISASGSGALATRDSVNLSFTRDLSDLITAGIGARVYTTNAIDETIGDFDERNYVQLRAQFIWHLSTEFSLETNYRYTFLDRELQLESANSNQVTVWLNYRPKPTVRSR
jgi:hypothetical protein